jgi:hypothetical protein
MFALSPRPSAAFVRSAAAAACAGVATKPLSSAAGAASHLVHFFDTSGTHCWGVAPPTGPAPKIGDSVPLAAVPALCGTNGGTPGESRTIAQMLPALPSRPPMLMCVGLNYKRHAEECNYPVPEYPVLFAKNPAAVVADGLPIRVPKIAQDPLEVGSRR